MLMHMLWPKYKNMKMFSKCVFICASAVQTVQNVSVISSPLLFLINYYSNRRILMETDLCVHNY